MLPAPFNITPNGGSPIGGPASLPKHLAQKRREEERREGKRREEKRTEQKERKYDCVTR